MNCGWSKSLSGLGAAGSVAMEERSGVTPIGHSSHGGRKNNQETPLDMLERFRSPAKVRYLEEAADVHSF